MNVFYDIKFKRITWSKEDSLLQQQIHKNEISIDNDVKELEEDCFDNWKTSDYLERLTIPSSVKIIPMNCFKECTHLTNISIPERFKLNGDKLYYEINCCLHSIKLPSSIKIINEKEVELQPSTTFIIPSHITRICIDDDVKIKEIENK